MTVLATELEKVEYAAWRLAADPTPSRMEDLLTVVKEITGDTEKKTQGASKSKSNGASNGASIGKASENHDHADGKSKDTNSNDTGTIKITYAGTGNTSNGKITHAGTGNVLNGHAASADGTSTHADTVKIMVSEDRGSISAIAESGDAVQEAPAKGMRVCRKCGEAQPESEYHRDASRLDGLRNCCKTCESAARKLRRLAEKERKAEKFPAAPR